MTFIHSFESEWIKKRRSLSSLLVLVGGFFTPVIIIVARLFRPDQLPAIYSAAGFWDKLWKSSWESMAIMLLPMGVIMATSLIAQLEYKNNTWKQLHTTPISLTTIYFSKLAVIIVMMLQFFVLFNIGIYLAGIVPYLLVSGVPYPGDPIPFLFFIKENSLYFIDCLPIIALQYLISLKYKNFLLPIGAGMLFWVGALGSLSWKYSFIIPYTYCMYHYLEDSGKFHPAVDIHMMAIGYFIVFTVLGYVLYLTKSEKG